VVVGFGRVWYQDALRCGGGTHRGFLRRLGTVGGWRRRFWQDVSIYHRSLLVIEKRQFDPKSSRVIIAVSEQVKRDIIANYSVPAEKIVVLYNGVDKDRFHPARRGRGVPRPDGGHRPSLPRPGRGRREAWSRLRAVEEWLGRSRHQPKTGIVIRLTTCQ